MISLVQIRTRRLAGWTLAARIAWITARVSLFCFGLLLAIGGILSFVVPEGLDSDASPRPPWFVEVMVDSGAIGYGVLLLASPRWLARSPRAFRSLVALTVVFGVGVALAGADRFSALQTSAAIAARIWPAALAILLVTLESGRPDQP